MSAPLPRPQRFVAPAGWQAIDFLSDLHLDERHPRTFEAWRHHLLNSPADAVILAGDIFEVWIGDDAATQGFAKHCADVLRQAATLRQLAFMAGNRDFLVGEAFLSSAGVTRLEDPTVMEAFGQRLLLTHGDALCTSDLPYQRFRAMVRDPAWQADFLARPLQERVAIARQLRTASEANKAGQAMSDWTDVNLEAASRWLQAEGLRVLVHGHTHRPGRQEWGDGFAREVLSDWDFDALPPRGEVLRWTEQGLRRLVPREASPP